MREDTTGTQREPVLLGPANKDDLVFGEDPKSSVAIPKALIARIWDQAREGVRTSRVGGLEVGGLLIGRRVDERIAVEETIPLPIEYREGPSFQLSPSDLATISPLIESAHRGSKLVVGFYRSRTRGEGVLRPSDLLILEAVERAHGSYLENFRCCFVLAPRSHTTAVLCVALRKGSFWSELQPVTLQSTQGAGFTEAAPAAPEPVARAEEKEVNRPVLPAGPMIPANGVHVRENLAGYVSRIWNRISREGGWRYAAVGVVSAATMWAIVGPATRPAQRDVPAAHLGFSATREGPRWRLTWDRVAIDTLSPVGGVLSVDDGVAEQQIPLALPDLASGTIFYTPRRENLTFSLRIDRGGAHVEENVRVVAAADIEADVGADPAPPAVRSPEPSREAVRAARGEREEIPPPLRASRSVEIAPPKVRKPVDVTVAMSVPSPGQDLALSSAESASGAGAAARIAPVAARIASVPPLAEANKMPEYVGPRAIQQPRPQLPTNLSVGLEAQVNVEIDTRGKVTKVIPIGWRPADAPLVVWAVRAVSAWVFEPAKADGRAVPSQMNLVFKS